MNLHSYRICIPCMSTWYCFIIDNALHVVEQNCANVISKGMWKLLQVLHVEVDFKVFWRTRFPPMEWLFSSAKYLIWHLCEHGLYNHIWKNVRFVTQNYFSREKMTFGLIRIHCVVNCDGWKILDKWISKQSFMIWTILHHLLATPMKVLKKGT